MVGEFLQRKKVIIPFASEEIEAWRSDQVRRVMKMPELSLSPSSSFAGGVENIWTESETKPSKKRKSSWNEPPRLTLIELQLKDPLPLDWEQCLDLQSGRMYYLNRKTLKRSWSWPKSHGLDLELNISPPQIPESFLAGTSPLSVSRSECYTSGGMVAAACLHCHLLVMLSTTSPCCPNCKFIHPLLPLGQQTSPTRNEDNSRSLETLSLLN